MDRRGRRISFCFILISLGVSLTAAWQPDDYLARIQLAFLAIASEAIKYLCNRTLWINRGVPWYGRILSCVAYAGCLYASVHLMQDLMARVTERDVAENAAEVSQIDTVAADRRQVEADVRAAEMAVEEAQREIQPGIRSAASLRAIIAADHLNKQELAELHAELEKAERNDRLGATVTRLNVKAGELRKSLTKSSPERPRRSQKTTTFTKFMDVHGRSERQNVLGLAAAILIEAAIIIGFMHDGFANRPAPAPTPIPVVVQQPVNVVRSMNVVTFEAWLHQQWTASRDKLGWLHGTQKAWAEAAGVSKGFVHAQLEALVAAGRIAKEASAGGGGRTRIRFLKAGELRIIK